MALYHWRIAFPYSRKNKKKPGTMAGLLFRSPDALWHATKMAVAYLSHATTY
jgi:hypothetical protein